MSAQHTPGRLYLSQKYKTVAHAEQGTWGRRVFDAYSMGDQTDNEANARRLVACWNACDGVPTELLEAYPAPFTELRAQRDELLAALKEARRWIGDGECSDGLAREHWTQEYRAAVDRIDAAIAKVEGGAA